MMAVSMRRIRNPKSEIRRKSEIRNPDAPDKTRLSGLRPSALLRISVCGSRISWPQFHCKDETHHPPRHKQERIGLEIARLHEAQGAAKNFGRAVQAADAETGNDPAIKPVGQTRNGFVRDSNQ